ncbi:hypothetical protein [Novosphingobium guangzhouense]|uniref:Acyltransferase 3 domain-containing protein n=1 Tax=Novosphingobium guangzhouense TaxID=1850347 RepID=A0A2K2G3S8_9SPHN|nr:hypothetical protein [Novosphingobium guangzhouense]PNU05686.1 hypothetical protein A8V01_15155 [Novosphingobium guangzhouense]
MPRSIQIGIGLGIRLVAGFVLLRFANVYGDKPWFHAETALRTAMSFLALTKYPPSLLFLMPTLGFSALMLALFEKFQNHATMPRLAMLGGAPMFYYLLHLYVLRALYLIALAIYGPNKGTVFGFDHVSTIWVWVALLIGPLYLPARWFARVKQQRKDVRWLKYL